ncbi:MAG: AMIN domain-containing protein, partial [Armatimonadetes bacterium]|nr:AMIN domain-containing protein [Armatimonadota bacterium]
MVETEGRLHVNVALSGPVAYTVRQWSAPPQIVIDFPGAVINGGRTTVLPVGRGVLLRVRAGQF